MLTIDVVLPVAAPSTRPSKAELTSRLMSLTPALAADRNRFQTALIYLASQWLPSIDRVAWFTGIDREYVARRARRWADRGVWDRGVIADDLLTAEWLALVVDVGEGLPTEIDVAGWLGAGASDEADLDDEDEEAIEDADGLLDALWTDRGITSEVNEPSCLSEVEERVPALAYSTSTGPAFLRGPNRSLFLR